MKQTQIKWEKEFTKILGTKFAGGGRIMANIGAHAYKKRSISNKLRCFTVKFGDSMSGIMKVASEAALILKSGCGIGYDFSTLRPRCSCIWCWLRNIRCSFFYENI